MKYWLLAILLTALFLVFTVASIYWLWLWLVVFIPIGLSVIFKK